MNACNLTVAVTALAEILILAKRMKYRKIFQIVKVSF